MSDMKWSGDFKSDVEAMVRYLEEAGKRDIRHRSLVSRALTGLRGILQREAVATITHSPGRVRRRGDETA
jgi:hypothetical protein